MKSHFYFYKIFFVRFIDTTSIPQFIHSTIYKYLSWCFALFSFVFTYKTTMNMFVHICLERSVTFSLEQQFPKCFLRTSGSLWGPLRGICWVKTIFIIILGYYLLFTLTDNNGVFLQLLDMLYHKTLIPKQIMKIQLSSVKSDLQNYKTMPPFSLNCFALENIAIFL